MKSLSTLADLHGQYDVLLCDIWGVVHNGRQAHTSAITALQQFRANGGGVVLITNSPRPRGDVETQLDTIGVPNKCWDALITSGDATRFVLQSHAPGPVFHLGPDRDRGLYDALPLTFTNSLADATIISCTGLYDDTSEGPDDYRDVLTQAKKQNLPMICANPDVVVHRGDDLIYCAGALAELYNTIGGQVILAGKPHTPIYQLSFDAAAKAGHTIDDKSRVLVIGDGLQTDIKGANDQDLDCMLITGGLARDMTAADIQTTLDKDNLRCQYIMEKFA